MAIIIGKELLEEKLLFCKSENDMKGILGEISAIEHLDILFDNDSFIICNPALVKYEADILLINPRLGFFFIEVKNWSIGFIEKVHANGIFTTRAKNNRRQNPIKQAENYRDELKNLLRTEVLINNDLHKKISMVVLFTNIHKGNFINRRDVSAWDESTKKTYFEKHYFIEDLNTSLIDRLHFSNKFRSSINENLDLLTISEIQESVDFLSPVIVINRFDTGEESNTKYSQKLEVAEKFEPTNLSSLAKVPKLNEVKVKKSGPLILISVILFILLIITNLPMHFIPTDKTVIEYNKDDKPLPSDELSSFENEEILDDTDEGIPIADEPIEIEEDSMPMYKKNLHEIYINKLTEVENTSVIESKVWEHGTDFEINEFAARDYEVWDNLLNEIYVLLRESLLQEEFYNLRDSQRKWIVTRNEIGKNATKDFIGGSWEAAVYNSALSEETRKRCFWLVNNYFE